MKQKAIKYLFYIYQIVMKVLLGLLLEELRIV